LKDDKDKKIKKIRPKTVGSLSKKTYLKQKIPGRAPVAHACNPSYLRRQRSGG
jgi:hypothetical protein